MMGQRTYHGVNPALFNTLLDADDAADSEFDFIAEGDAQDESVQRKRRHRVGSKPPWLRHAIQDEPGAERRARRHN